MKKLKYQILFVILMMTIGAAAVATNLVLNGSTSIASNSDGFLVYFSDVSISQGEDKGKIIVNSDKKFTLKAHLQALSEKVAVDFYITNASKDYDANVTYTCNENSDYISLSYRLDSNTVPSMESVFGVLDVTLVKTYTGESEVEEEITCTISASAVERTSQGSGNVSEPILNGIQFVSGDGTNVGDELKIANEHFYVVSNDGVNTVLLAKYNLDVGNDCSSGECSLIVNPSGIQSSRARGFVSFDDIYGTVPFSDTDYWEDFDDNLLPEYGTSYPAYVYDENSNLKIHVDNYASYLREIGFNIDGARLIKYEELVELGCKENGQTCLDSEHEWVYSTSYWSGSAFYDIFVWAVMHDGIFFDGFYEYVDARGIRPVIEVSTKDLKIIKYFDVDSRNTDYIDVPYIYGMTWGDFINSDMNNGYFRLDPDGKPIFDSSNGYETCYLYDYNSDDLIQPITYTPSYCEK